MNCFIAKTDESFPSYKNSISSISSKSGGAIITGHSELVKESLKKSVGMSRNLLIPVIAESNMITSEYRLSLTNSSVGLPLSSRIEKTSSAFTANFFKEG